MADAWTEKDRKLLSERNRLEREIPRTKYTEKQREAMKKKLVRVKEQIALHQKGKPETKITYAFGSGKGKFI